MNGNNTIEVNKTHNRHRYISKNMNSEIKHISPLKNCYLKSNKKYPQTTVIITSIQKMISKEVYTTTKVQK